MKMQLIHKNMSVCCFLKLNTQYMTNSTLVCPVKIEYVTKNNIFGLKMFVCLFVTEEHNSA